MEGVEKEAFVKQKHKPDPAARRWTIMIMGRVGKVRTFKVSPRVLLWTFLFLILYLPFTVFVFNEWVDLRRDNRGQLERIEQLKEELARAERTLFKFQQHVALLDSYIVSLKGEQRPPAEELPAPAEPVAPPQPAPQPAPSEPEPAAEPAAEERPEPVKPESGPVDIKQMTIRNEDGIVKVNFNLVNVDKGEDAVSGYIHILARGGREGAPWWEIYPRGDVKEGQPKNYRSGQPFIIQRFKPIHGEFNARAERGAPESIRVVVFDDGGGLIFEETYEVENAS